MPDHDMLERLHAELHVWIARPALRPGREGEAESETGAESGAGAGRSAPPDEFIVSPEDEVLLSDVERQRHRRYIRAADRDVFLTAHALVRRTLSRYFAIAPADWTFATNPYGRPEITNPEAPRGLRFNLSHTRGMVAVLVHDEVDAGVDVEHIVTIDNLHTMANTVFADNERTELLALPAHAQLALFYRLWTLKEAFIKAKGMGLALPLKGFWFSAHDPMALRVGCREAIDAEPDAWTFTVSQPSPNHVLATACRSGQDRPARQVTIFDTATDTHTYIG